MSDIFILYVAFSYLYMLGAVIEDLTAIKSEGKFATIVALLLAPIMMPMVLGILTNKYSSKEG